MDAGSKDDQYSEKEAQRRFEQTVRGGLSTSPKPLKDVRPKKPKAQRKPKKETRGD